MTKRKERFDGHNFIDHPDPSAAWSAARLALQPELGLFREWIIGIGSRGGPAPGALWPDLMPGS